jgi:hypothetical protein
MSSTNHLPKYRVRPRFKFHFEDNAEAFIDSVSMKLKVVYATCLGKVD